MTGSADGCDKSGFTGETGSSMKRIVLIPVLGGALAGCHPAAAPAPASVETPLIGVEMVRVVPELRVQRFNTLLDLESDVDAVFVLASGGGARLVDSRAHTGRRALEVTDRSPSIDIKLSSLLTGRSFPGNWALVGAYVRSDNPCEVVAELLEGDRVVTSSAVRPVPGRWTALMLDLSRVAAPDNAEAPTAPGFRLRLRWRGEGPLWVDDVMLVDNLQQLLEGGPDGMSVRKRGMTILCQYPGRFAVALDMLEGNPEGWTVEEVSPIRARFAGGGKTRSLVIYDNGLSYWDGEPRSLFGMLRLEDGWGRQHRQPGKVSVGQTPGRVRRTTPGDADNDGYNELTGAYQLEAEGARLEVTIEPDEQLVSPVLEIVGLPVGRVTVTAEGRLIDDHARLPDGRVLIRLPLRFQRPLSVLVRVQ